MKTVWKFPLSIEGGDTVEVEVPAGAEFIHFAQQNGTFCAWALVDPELAVQKRLLRVAGTGHDIDHKVVRHIGSTMIADGVFVFHLFEIVVP